MLDDAADDLHPRVRRALTRLGAEDRRVADEAEHAWRWMAGEDSPDALLQHRLQEFLWYALPRKWDTDLAGQLAAAEALARLFDLLAAPRYAALCRAAETRAVLEAYARDGQEGFWAFRRALDRSGIAPPDLPGLSWGGMMSVEEALAYEHVAVGLEEAVRAGRVAPGRRGWRAAQRGVAAEALAEPVPRHPGSQTWLQTIVTARIQGWVERYRDAPRRWRLVARLEPALLHPVAVPGEAGAVVAPLCWLLARAAGDGLALTERGNLARAVVREMCAEFGWRPLGRGKTVQREDDMVEVVVWHDFARAAGLVRRRGRRLLATPAGRLALTGVEPAWRALAAGLLAADGWEGFVRETALLLLLDAPEGRIHRDRLLADLSELAAEAGWRDQQTGDPPGEQAVSLHASPFVYHLSVMGLVEQRHALHEPTETRLLPVGRPTLVEALRVRASGPRKVPT